MLRYHLCNERDCAVWIKLNRAFMSEEINDNELWNNANRISDEAFREIFLQGLQRPDMVRFMLFEEDEEPIGFANLMLVYSVWSHGLAMIVDDLYFIPGNRGQGNGRDAMEMIEAYAKKQGCKRIQFQTEPTNPDAKEFYRAIGYHPADMYFYVKYFDD